MGERGGDWVHKISPCGSISLHARWIFNSPCIIGVNRDYFSYAVEITHSLKIFMHSEKPVFCRQLPCIECLVTCRKHVISIGDSRISNLKEFMTEKFKSNIIKRQECKIDTYRSVSIIILILSQEHDHRAIHDIQTGSKSFAQLLFPLDDGNGKNFIKRTSIPAMRGSKISSIWVVKCLIIRKLLSVYS